MYNRSKKISIIIRHHKCVDGKSYQMTTIGESNTSDCVISLPMQQPDTIFFKLLYRAVLALAIVRRWSIFKCHLLNRRKMNSTPNGMLQMTDTRIEVETIETKPKSKCKSNKRK